MAVSALLGIRHGHRLTVGVPAVLVLAMPVFYRTPINLEFLAEFQHDFPSDALTTTPMSIKPTSMPIVCGTLPRPPPCQAPLTRYKLLQYAPQSPSHHSTAIDRSYGCASNGHYLRDTGSANWCHLDHGDYRDGTRVRLCCLAAGLPTSHQSRVPVG